MTLAESADRLNRAAIGLQKDREKRQLERKYRPKYSAFFRNQKNLTLAELRKHSFLFSESFRVMKEKITPINAPNELLTTHDWDSIWKGVDQASSQDLQALLAQNEGEAVLKGGEQLAKAANIEGKFWDLANPRAVAWFQRTGGSVQYIKDIQQTTADQVRTIITQAIDEGWSYQVTAKTISDRFDDFSRDRAQRIAVYETGNAYEAGNRMFADNLKDDGIELEKMWNTSHDDKVSDLCRGNEDDGWIPITQPHSSGHQQPCGHVNCRCYETYRQAQNS